MMIPSNVSIVCFFFLTSFFVCSELFRVQQDAFKTTIKLVPWNPSTLISGEDKGGRERVSRSYQDRKLIWICRKICGTRKGVFTAFDCITDYRLAWVCVAVAYLKIWSGTLKIRLIATSVWCWSCSDDNLFACSSVEALLRLTFCTILQFSWLPSFEHKFLFFTEINFALLDHQLFKAMLMRLLHHASHAHHSRSIFSITTHFFSLLFAVWAGLPRFGWCFSPRWYLSLDL